MSTERELMSTRKSIVSLNNIIVLLVLLALGMLAAWKRGQDINWDLCNYHLYNPWAYLNHVAYHFSAGIQGYFDPYLDIPYYWLAMGPLHAHPEILQALCGIPYGILLFEIYWLASLLVASIGPAHKIQHGVLVWSMVLLAGTGAATWVQIGTTTNEITVAAVVLFGIIILVAGVGEAESRKAKLVRAAAVGACIGMAAGLKLTAGIYLPAVGLLYLLEQRPVRGRIVLAMVYSCAAVGVFCLAYGPWGEHLYELTGNPFFPMFNDIFHSSMEGTSSAGRDLRFLPRDIWQWLFYPFFWLTKKVGTVYELPFRDARFAASYSIFVVTFLVVTMHGGARTAWKELTKIKFLMLFSIAAYVLWLIMFSILRYSIVIESAICIATLSIIYVSARSMLKVRASSTVAMCIVSVVSVALCAYGRATKTEYVKFGNYVYDVGSIKLPERSLVVFANQPMGFLAPLIAREHKEVAFAGIPSSFGPGAGAYEGFYHYGLGRQLRTLLGRYSKSIYVAYYANRLPTFPGLNAFGVRVNFAACQSMNNNVVPSVEICKAAYLGHPVAMRPAGYKLNADATLTSGMALRMRWMSDACVSRAKTDAIRFDWSAPSDVKGIKVYDSQRRGAKTLFASGGASGSATTGQWVQAGQRFLFEDASGALLANVGIRYLPCGDASK